MLLKVMTGKAASRFKITLGDNSIHSFFSDDLVSRVEEPIKPFGDTPPNKRARVVTEGAVCASSSVNGSDKSVPLPVTPCAPGPGYRLVIEPTQFFDRWKTRKALSAEHVAGVLDRFRLRNLPHLDLHPVYLGYCVAYCDWPDVVTTAQLHRRIVAEFRDMLETAFNRHLLADFFGTGRPGTFPSITR